MKHIAGNTYTTRIGYTDIGVYVDGNSAILIDTGSEEKTSLLTLLENHHLTPRAIINTHLHIDHIGCNKLLQEKFECLAYCSMEEIAVAIGKKPQSVKALIHRAKCTLQKHPEIFETYTSFY